MASKWPRDDYEPSYVRWVLLAGMSGAMLLLFLWFVSGLIASRVKAHDFYPPDCCSGHDCRPISSDAVEFTASGFLVKENGEVVPYGSQMIRRTPPEGGGRYHRCSRGGTREGATICLYIPDWGS